MSEGQKTRSLSGKVAIVTGASRGIGHSIASELASRGAKVVITYSSDRSKIEADKLVCQCQKEYKTDAIGVQCNLNDTSSPKKIIDATVAAFGSKIDILVNNAGAISGAKLEEITADHFDEIMHLNVRAPMLMVQAVLPHLHRPGRIINISSVGARGGYEGSSTYAASKAALEAYTRAWAFELGEDGTTVNCVNPGPVQSEMLDQVDPAVVEPQLKRTAVQQRPGLPEEIAAVVAFLAEPSGSWVSGQCISASGGLREALY